MARDFQRGGMLKATAEDLKKKPTATQNGIEFVEGAEIATVETGADKLPVPYVRPYKVTEDGRTVNEGKSWGYKVTFKGSTEEHFVNWLNLVSSVSTYSKYTTRKFNTYGLCERGTDFDSVGKALVNALADGKSLIFHIWEFDLPRDHGRDINLSKGTFATQEQIDKGIEAEAPAEA